MSNMDISVQPGFLTYFLFQDLIVDFLLRLLFISQIPTLVVLLFGSLFKACLKVPPWFLFNEAEPWRFKRVSPSGSSIWVPHDKYGASPSAPQ